VSAKQQYFLLMVGAKNSFAVPRVACYNCQCREQDLNAAVGDTQAAEQNFWQPGGLSSGTKSTSMEDARRNGNVHWT